MSVDTTTKELLMISENLVKELNQTAGSKMEGNLCYVHHQVPENNEFYKGFENKRKNIVAMAKKYNNITEIGFNAGHSAALMLSANPQLHLTSIDIGTHSYTTPCANIIQQYFPNRHNLILKDSNKIDKHEIEQSDVVIIDGGHEFYNCLLDIAICVAYCKPGTLIVIDDYNYPPITEATGRFLSSLTICNEFINDRQQGIFYLK
jgi:predicted O-methyltransferase YrrM